VSYIIIIGDIAFYVFVVFFVLQIFNIVFHKDIPNIRTAPAIRRKIIELLKEDFEKRKEQESPYTIVDLGAGSGLLTREIARALPGAKVIGIELAKHTYAYANWQKRRVKLDNLEYVNMNFLNYDLSSASAVTMYLVPYVMTDLGKKLRKEARPGTLILSNKFRLFDGWEPQKTLHIKTLYFHQKVLHIYRKT